MEESEFEKKSGDTREKNYEVGDKKPPIEHRFSSTNQPPKENQIAGMKRKREARDFMKDLLSSRYLFGPQTERLKQLMESSFGKKVGRMNAVELMVVQQIQKAILKGDTQAFNSVLNQCYGMPKQVQELTTPAESELHQLTTEELMEKIRETAEKLK